MFANLTGNTSIPEYFTIGWFRFPISLDRNYETILIIHDVLVVLSCATNPILLFIIIKTLPSSSGKNSGILLASICLTNIFVFGFGLVELIGGIGQGIMTQVMSIFLPMYYLITFCLALNNYGLIVTPLKFKTSSPKPKTMVFMLGFVWTTVTLVLVVAPNLAPDFDLYVKVMSTTIVVLCYIASIIVAVMYTKILLTLRHRKLALHRTLNVSRSRQGIVVIKQNTKLTKVFLFYTVVLIALTMPLYTSMIITLYCTLCNRTTLDTFTLYAILPGMSMPIIHVFHWMFATPQYYRELKRLLKKLFACCVKKASMSD